MRLNSFFNSLLAAYACGASGATLETGYSSQR